MLEPDDGRDHGYHCRSHAVWHSGLASLTYVGSSLVCKTWLELMAHDRHLTDTNKPFTFHSHRLSAFR